MTLHQACCCVTTLQWLQTTDSTVTGLHASGLMACCALQDLDFQQSRIEADSGDNVVSNTYDEDFQFPDDLTPLMRLEKFCIEYDGANTMNLQVDMKFLYALNSLRSSQVICEEGSLVVSSELTRLEALTYLEMTVRCNKLDVEDFEGNFIKLDVEWKAMQASKDLRIDSDYLMCGKGLLGLCNAQSLTRIIFANLKPLNWESCQSFAKLVYHLGRQRPDIVFTMGTTLLADGMNSFV